MSPEKEFLEELNIFRNEAMLASKFLYTELAIRNIANKNKKILNALNYSPTFWNLILSALQNSTFITFGRIFDNNGKNSISTLFKVTQKNKNIFTKESFANRWTKNQDRNKIDHWLPEYLKKVYVPKDNDLVEFGKFIEKQKDIYKKIYKPVRNHFGHKIYNKNEDVKVLFDKIQINELEKFCVRLDSIHEALWQLYHNGRGPLLPIKQGRYSTKNILKTKFKPYVTKPANAQFIYEVTTVLNLLELGKMTKDKKYKSVL
jgi:hypothetical protein